jgi:hypothetical protein
VALGHELGKSVVAEGVETPEDAAFLRSINCQYAQGFYYGEPMSDRDVMQLLKMVRTAEHKLRPRGLFRAKPKSKQRDKKTDSPAAVAAKSNGAGASGRQGAGRPPAPPATLPNSTVRPRMRPQMAPQSAGLPPPPLAQMHHDGVGQDDFDGMPPPPPHDFGVPQHASMSPPQFGAPPHQIFDGGPPQSFDGGPPPPTHMDQFSTPEHYEPPAPHEFAPPPMHPGNGAHPPFNGFAEAAPMPPILPPLGSHDMPGLPPAHEAPFEPNPLVAALAHDPLPEPPRLPPAFAPAQHSLPPRRAVLPRLHAGKNGSGNGASNGATNGVKPATQRPKPDFSGLPPAMAESLAKLAGMPWPPPADGLPSDGPPGEEQVAPAIPGTPRRES